jgi:hypothetical protein
VVRSWSFVIHNKAQRGKWHIGPELKELKSTAKLAKDINPSNYK